MNKAENNRKAQATWYAKQKNNGIIYLLTFLDGDTYVGKTTGSLAKRLWRHKATPTKGLVGKDFTGAVITLLYERKAGEDLGVLEQKFIKALNPPLNFHHTDKMKCRSAPPSKVYEHKGIYYRSKKAAWLKVGEVPYGTFKSRMNRGFTMSEALAKKLPRNPNFKKYKPKLG